MKALLNAIHDLLKKLLHIILIPVIAVLKGIDSLCQHLITELTKV